LTPLNLAVKNSQIEIAKVLIECGADPFITDNSGECALSYAIESNSDILNYIVQILGNKKDMTGEGILHYAARTGDLLTIKKLLSMGLDKTMRNISGETAYDIAVRWQRSSEIIDVLK
jgi:ankyrin repeat protein